MSPLILHSEHETKSVPSKYEDQGLEKNVSGRECGGGRCACLKPCANCTCRDKKSGKVD